MASKDGTNEEQEGVRHHHDKKKTAIGQACKEPPVAHEHLHRIYSKRCKKVNHKLDISERSSSTKFKLIESTKRNAWLSLWDTSPWRATNSESVMLFGVIDILAFLHTSLLLKPWCIIIEQGDTTQSVVHFS